MIGAFRKIWDFAGSEQKNIKSSIVLALLHSIFYALQFAAVYVVLKALTDGDTSKINALYALAIMAASIIGRIVLNTYSQLQRVHAGYFMVANKRISIGAKLRTVPMGYFNKNNLGQMTAVTTTTLTDVENTAPVVLVTVLGGFINSIVFALSVLLFDRRIGAIVFIGMAAFIRTTSLQEKLRLGILIITHDLDTAMFMADRIYVMRCGSIAETIDSPKSFGDFRADYSKQLVRAAEYKRQALK